MPETKEAPERLWRTTNAYIYNGPTPEPCVEYIRKDVADATVEQARREVWEKAIAAAKSQLMVIDKEDHYWPDDQKSNEGVQSVIEQLAAAAKEK